MRVSSNLCLRALGLCTALLAQSAAASAPNVLIILADDLGWNDVGYHGSEIETPRLDALAEQGVILNQYHTQPTCTPTRAALMTGKSPQRLGIYRQFAKISTSGLPIDEQTMADLLSEASYQTWLIGKWHLGHATNEFHPNSRGFDHFYGHVTGGIGYWDHVHGGGLDWQRNGTTVREAGYSTHLLADEAVHMIRTRDPDRPFFLYASFNAPHLPNEAPDDAISAYSDITNPQRRLHAAMVSELDHAIGRIVDTLANEEVLEDTLIWFMSDNGGLNPAAGLGGYLTLAEWLDRWFDPPVPVRFLEFIRTNALDGGADNAPLRYGKGSVYQGGVRVPSFVYFPDALAAHRFNHMVTVQDVLPTVLDAVGSDAPDDLDGRSRWAELRGVATDVAIEATEFTVMGQGGEQAYYRWPWKLIEGHDGPELYDLTSDPLEQHDLAATESQRVQALAAGLAALPRAPSLHIPIYKVMLDPDFFGGEEDRAPWSELDSHKD